MLLNMGIAGWIVSLLVGFVVGGLFFISIKLQAEYVVEKRGPDWLIPAACYARLLLVAVVLVLVALAVPRTKVAAAMLAGAAGSIVARALVTRAVRRRADAAETPAGK